MWSTGIIWSKISNKALQPRYTKSGYARVHLGAHTDFYIHRLVAQAFIPNPNNFNYVNHINENKKDNSVNNLEWCSIAYNNTYGNRCKNSQYNQPSRKVVLMCDKNNHNIVLKEFISIREAQRETGISNISKVCNNKQKSAGGYFWKFKI